MSEHRFHYFAYGSNLLSARLRERTPSARVIGPAVLARHELRWHNVGMDGSGKCDVIAATRPDSHVLGVVYEIDRADKPVLDAAESLGVGYAERETVITLAGRPMTAWIYHALMIDAQLLPYDWYKALVLAGAREHGFDPHYVDALRAVPSRPDADAARAAHHFRLAGLDGRCG